MADTSNAVLLPRGGPGLLIVSVPVEYSFARIREVLQDPVLYDILSPPGDLPYRGRSVGVYFSGDSRTDFNYTASLMLAEDVEKDVLLLKTFDDDEHATKTIPFTSDDIASLLKFPKNMWTNALCGRLDYNAIRPARCRVCNLPYGLLPTGEDACACVATSGGREVV